MKIILKYIFIFYVSFDFYSQNLVNNPSFEEYIDCPNDVSQIELAYHWFNANEFGTAEYYNACATEICCDVPCSSLCDFMFQYAKTGNAYAGISVYNPDFEGGKEYVLQRLNNKLKLNKCYYFSMFINSMNWSNYGINKMGVSFTDTNQFIIDSNDRIELTPQIFSENIVADTLNWFQVFGTFISNGTEQYLTIGNFFVNSELDTLFFNNLSLNSNTYYLIDDVVLLELGENYAGKDTTINTGQSVTLGYEVENLPCIWRKLTGELIAENVSSLNVSPLETTTYICEQNFCGQVMFDTVTVFVNGVGLTETHISPKIIISPNPNDGTFSIELNTSIAIQELYILDALGRKIQVLDDKETYFEVKLQKGVYFLEIKTDKNHFLEKIVVN
jgi:OOP family OmpA-OmpF porin